ncbi:MAG: MaoC family dehydratase [Pseudomonadota bacterium]
MHAHVGREIAISPWIEVTQAMIDRFADATEDHQFIHVDPDRARVTPFGGTIAHGFLTASLLAPLAQRSLPTLEGRVMGVNYGFDRLRFLSPVKAGARVRARFTLSAVSTRTPKQIVLHLASIVEIEGETKPALQADWLTMSVLG